MNLKFKLPFLEMSNKENTNIFINMTIGIIVFIIFDLIIFFILKAGALTIPISVIWIVMLLFVILQILLLIVSGVSNKNNEKEIAELTLELENRFSSLLNHIEKPNKNWGVFKTFIVASENILNGRCNAYVSKEFEMTPTLQLLLELKAITKKADKLNDISNAIAGIKKLSNIILPGWGDTKINATPENDRIKIQNEILLIIKTSNFAKWRLKTD